MMKIRLIAWILAAASVLALASCGGGLPVETTPAGTAETVGTVPETTAEETNAQPPVPKISHPATRAALDAIPVATPDMTVEQLRAICVEYMTMQQSVVWTPDANWTYTCSYAGSSDSAGQITLRRGVRYGGLPYTGAALDLATFLDFYEEETGVLKVSSMGSGAANLIGDTCSTSCYWGWARVSSTHELNNVPYLVPRYHYTPLGPYTYDFDLDSFKTKETGVICRENGEQTMFQSYASLQPASGLVNYKNGTTGHVRMVKDAAVVVRNADGTIDGKQSFVTCVEQVSSQKPETGEDGTVQCIGKVGYKYTFLDLYNAGYLPFEIYELSGKASVQKAEVHLENGAADLEGLLKDTVLANYPISRTKAVFRAADGAVAYETAGYGSAYDSAGGRDMKIQKVFSASALRRNLKKGETYTLTLEVRLGNGETLPLEFDAFTYQP